MSCIIKNLTGKIFGRLTVIKSVNERDNHGSICWECRCDCGNVKIISSTNLVRGFTKSCGCLNKEMIIERSSTHGQTNTVEYQTLRRIIQRCTNVNNPDYCHYGGRGISVCDRWLESFEAFYADMGPRPSDKHSIDRKDTNGHYEPSNCCWATAEEQNNNRNNSIKFNFNGILRNSTEISRELNIPINLVKNMNLERLL